MFIENIDMLEEEIKPILSFSSSNSNSNSDESLKDVKPHIHRKSPTNPKSKSSNTDSKTSNSMPKKKQKIKVEFNMSNSSKAKFAENLIDQGIKNYDKTLVEAETGFTKSQQAEMLKKGRGSLWKALYGFASTL
ncbi:uncharacterized protein I206_100736 [Kwoniella pini CBS 10737]|uniref:Uncharacterized protein n=1 Tax=Kwoniella pini CBS 10737 TaxID=1296096 RepID=A0A1B9ID99_9TREE|nr:uncharacterized protein I206_00591 [Kwoniella pini CBS 10737]OCF53290.1 hypothetical protein I206_00591 [Kwoniella pini CBS 10737]